MSETRALAPTETELGKSASSSDTSETPRRWQTGSEIGSSINPLIALKREPANLAKSDREKFGIAPSEQPDLVFPIGREPLNPSQNTNMVDTNGITPDTIDLDKGQIKIAETYENGNITTAELQPMPPDRTKDLTAQQHRFVADEAFTRIAKNGLMGRGELNVIMDQAIRELPGEYAQLAQKTEDTIKKVEFPNPDEGWEKTQIMNPEVKRKIKRLMNSKIAKAIIGVGIAVLLLAMDDKGPQVVRGNNPDDLGPNVPERTIDPKLLEDLVGKPLREWFWPRATHPTPWATVIPKGVDYTPRISPNKKPDVGQELDPKYLHDSIEMDLKGESIGGWADKIAVMFSDPYVAKHQLEYANQKGVHVTDPDLFMQTFNKDPKAARQLLEYSLRAIENAHAGLPDNSIVLQGG